MTTTPVTTSAPAKPKSDALLAVEALDHKVELIGSTIDNRFDSIMSEVRALRSDLGTVRGLVETLTDQLKQKPVTPVSALTSGPRQGNTVTFHADSIVMTYNDRGEPAYKLKGGRYTQFGVRVWPEVLPLLGIDPKSLKPGPNPVSLNVIAELSEKVDEETGQTKTIANKVIGLAQA